MGIVAAAGLLGSPLRPAHAIDLRPNVPEGAISVKLNTVVSYLPPFATEITPLAIEAFNDGTGRMFLSTVNGTIRIMDGNKQLVSTPLLTKEQSGLVLPQEAGMTGLAVHPDFNHPGTFGYGKIYTITTEAPEDDGGLPDSQVDFPKFTNEEHQDVVREWDLATFGNVPGNAANGQFTGMLTNSRELLRVDQPGPFHNLADLAFNSQVAPGDPDYGNLYITSGDGGDHSGYNRFQSAQDRSTIYGKILRINPDPTKYPLVRTSVHTGQPAYSIPTNNPFNGDNVPEVRTSSTLAEIFAYGVRSPFRISFDRQTGALYLGDVGENTWEEVNVITAGANYGWGQMEGNHDAPNLPGDGTLLPGLTRPIAELNHSDSRSIAGGFVYRGNAIPSLRGKYVFADLGQGFTTGALFYAIVDPNDASGPLGQVYEFRLDAASSTFGGNSLPVRMYAFGEDENGELYFSGGPDPRNPSVGGPNAVIVRLEASTLPSVLNDVAGDVDQNGVLDPVVDVNAFIAGWKTTGHIGDVAKYTHGDLNLDGRTDLFDVRLMRDALAALGATFPLELLVPEPSSLALAIMVAAGAARRGVRKRR